MYPSPALVVGVGRFGLSVLERLGEDWMWLGVSGGDPSLANLRLLHVHAHEHSTPEDWRFRERQATDLARYAGESSLPGQALDLVILRSLGLVRYSDGYYQLALPQDRGVVEVRRPEPGAGDRERLVRRRFFRWLTLDTDPIVSVEQLRELVEQRSEVDLFVSPILNRFRQGHSPQLLLCCISRYRALAEGRDPSPWSWLEQVRTHTHDAPGGWKHLHVAAAWLTGDDRAGTLDGFVPDPLPGYRDFLASTDPASSGPASSGPARSDPASPPLEIHLPPGFLPGEADLASPLDPREFLWVDWETTGWATGDLGFGEQTTFEPVRSSAFRLGFFDHDDTHRQVGINPQDAHKESVLGARLRELAEHVHRGLVRLWVDVQRRQETGRRELRDQDPHHADLDTSVRQSLEVLGELVVRPVLEARSEEDLPPLPPRRDDPLDEDEPLPAEPGAFLKGLVVEQGHEDAFPLLTRRLAELGAGGPDNRSPHHRPLLRSVSLEPAEIEQRWRFPTGGPYPEHPPGPGLLRLRQVVNEEVRHLYRFEHLATYRQHPTRRPPRLTVFLVGDMGDPFTRTTLRKILRELHGELLRAFGPIFETWRTGFDRALAVIPVLWMPHAIDAFGGGHPLENRCEEASIIEAVHGIRRWAETIPANRLSVPQIFVNARVTDNAVISLRDAIRQTRDYLSLQLRNDTGTDDWLRWTTISPEGANFFSSFSCYEIDFPARRAQEYLANRLARACLARLRHRPARPTTEPAPGDFSPPPADTVTEPARRRLASLTAPAARSLADQVRQRIALTPTTDPEQVASAFDPGFQDRLERAVRDRWRALIRQRGRMDGMVRHLRQRTEQARAEAVDRVRRRSDRLVADHARRGGVRAIQAGFHALTGLTDDQLQQAEARRRQGEERCQHHGIPHLEPLEEARAAVQEANAARPRHLPMVLGFLAGLPMIAAVFTPFVHGLARLLSLEHHAGTVYEALLGPWAPLAVTVVLAPLVAWLLHRHLLQTTRRLSEAIENMARKAHHLVHGPDDHPLDAPPSIRSFLEARLRFTADLASRGFCLQVHEQALRDGHLADRLERSIDVQLHILERRAENLGVRPALDATGQEHVPDDPRGLFRSHAGDTSDRLIRPERLQDYYVHRMGPDEALGGYQEAMVQATGGFDRWRRAACLSDTERIMAYTRREFEAISTTPISRQASFEEEVGANLCRFVARHYPNIGFGAKFSGYEGLDPDGVQVLADAALVLHPELAALFEQTRHRDDTPPTTQTLQVKRCRLRPDTAYMISLVHDVSASSIRNLVRYETVSGEPHIPESRVFPRSGEVGPTRPDVPITVLTGHDALRQRLAAAGSPDPGESDD